MVMRIEVETTPDARGAGARNSITAFLGLPVERVTTRSIYKIDAPLTPEEGERVRLEITDPVTQLSSLGRLESPGTHWVLRVGLRPGVTDNLGRSAQVVVEDLLERKLAPGSAVYSETEYHLEAQALDRAEAQRIGTELLANLLIESLTVLSAREWATAEPDQSVPRIQDFSQAQIQAVPLPLDSDGLLTISRERTLSLSLGEMEAIRAHYLRPDVAGRRDELGLPEGPTDAELECLAQTWSEHCKHKIFNATIHYRNGGEAETINSLFNTYIRGTTEEVEKRVDWLVSVFHDNAGVIRLDEDQNLVFKVETHNSPSALDPYGGAITGIVGVNRDPFGTGRGAALAINVWGYCLASPFYDGPVPEGLLHPRRVRDGVHKGVIDGGNQSGIPYGRGWEFFDERYLGKPLVYCGTVGIMPREIGGEPSHAKTVRPGDRVVMVGGRVGKDGIHGATFSSEELRSDSPVQAVQIGDPITQKKMTDFLLEARDLGLYTSITDNGAGGLSSSVGEMATLCGGAVIDLEKAPLKYAGLDPWEILVSEAQERMTLAVPPDRLEAFLALARRREVEATDLGEFTAEQTFLVTYGDRIAADLDMGFLHDGCPRMELDAIWETRSGELPESLEPLDHGSTLHVMARRLNLCSGEHKARQYDHEVKGLSVVKPFVGVGADIPSDASVFLAGHDRKQGIVLSEGIGPRYSDLDTRDMAEVITDLAVRRSVAVGAEVGRLAALDNFCWPDPVQSRGTPDGHYKLAQLVRACQGLNNACLAFDLPLISGKDSMKNDSIRGGVKISVPPTLLVSVVGVLDDVSHVVTLDAKTPGDLVYVLGETRAELGATEYLAWRGEAERGRPYLGRRVPTVDLESSRKICLAVSRAIRAGTLRSVHALGPGGLALGLFRVAAAGQLGLRVDLSHLPGEEGLSVAEKLYSESGGRFLFTIDPNNRKHVEQAFQGVPLTCLGEVTSSIRLQVLASGQDRVLDEDVLSLKRSWKETLHGI